MTLPTLILITLCWCVCEVNSQQLPQGALVLEKRDIPKVAKKNRSLVLWMLRPEKHANVNAPDEIYTCPDFTRGSYYSGPTKVSLVDSASNKIINTIDVSADEDENLDLPYAIRKGYYYHVPDAVESGVEASPTIMWLRDYNGDGAALEFALFNAEACMGLHTTLIGYSKKQDRVIQYPIRLRTISKRRSFWKTTFWADYLFIKKPQRGLWKYEVDYRGRGGTLDRWTVRYNSTRERFEATVMFIPGPN
jgi:hypothetical protein